MTITRPALRYFGGKWRLAPWIIAHLPPHRCYVEPFGGAASVLMRKPRSYAEVYNDLAGDVVNVFRVLRDPEQATRLEHLARLTPFARDEFVECTSVAINAIDDPVERARRTVFRALAGFGSAASNPKHATGFRANSNKSGSTPAHDWMNWPNHVAAWTERLAGVVIENRDALAVMAQHDAVTTLHYVDPPYVHSTRMLAAAKGRSLYVHEMTDDHRYLVQPPFIVNQQANSLPTAMHDAMATMLASANHKWLVEPRDSFSVDDCGFRMLEPHECGAAMAFPRDYVVLGGKRDRVKQYGNAVTPPVMDILMQRCMESLR